MSFYDFIRNNTKINPEEENIILFGLNMIKMVGLALFTAIIISIIMGEFFEAVVFLTTLIPLRQFAGGYHTKHKWTCYIMSLIIYIASLLFIKMIEINCVIQILVVFVSIVIIFSLAPIDNADNELDDNERYIFADKTRMTFIIELLAFMFLIIFNLHAWSKIIVTAMSIVSLLLIAGYADNKIRDLLISH